MITLDMITLCHINNKLLELGPVNGTKDLRDLIDKIEINIRALKASCTWRPSRTVIDTNCTKVTLKKSAALERKLMN